MKKCSVIVFLLLLVSHVLVAAEVFTGAQWLSLPKEDVKENLWTCFRKEFNCRSVPKEAILNISVDSKYWLWVNEKLVIFEGALKRGPNPNDTYYDSVDISSYLKSGDNIIALQVCYWGKEGYCHKDSGRLGLLVDLAMGKKHILSDKSWKAIVHPAYGDTPPPHPNYRLPESNIHFDARKDIGEWQSKEYDDTEWASAVECGFYPCAPWNSVVKRPFPNWKDSGIIEYDSLRWSEDKSQLIGYLPRNISITPYMKVQSQNGGELIDIRTDNYKGGSEYNIRAEYVTKPGVQSFEALNYINGHSVIYSIPKGVEVQEVGYRETRFNTEFIGAFTCDDEFYNKLWIKSRNTMNLNMRDAIQDPDRERSQWWGDAVIVSGEIFYACDNNGKNLVKKAIDNLIDWQKEDGVLFSPIPAGSWSSELPVQMLASVGKFGFWNYYKYTADKETIARIYGATKKYLSLWELDERGLVIHRAGGWDWSDWGQDIDVAVLDNAWYSIALEGLKGMAELLGDTATAKECEERMSIVKESVNRYLYNGKLYRTPFYNGRTDDRANGLAVLAGFASDEQWQSIREYLNSYVGASPYMEKYILESYFSRGDVEGALKRMKGRYHNMVNHTLTTLWEDWQIGGAGGGSINHGWAGGPLTLLLEYVAGVSPIEAGWQSFMVKPMLGELKWVEAVVPLDRGVVAVKVDSQNRIISVKCEESRRFTLALDKEWLSSSSKCVINDKEYDNTQLKSLKKAKLSFSREDDAFVYLDFVDDRAEIQIVTQ